MTTSFKKYLNELDAEKSIVFTFGRFNPFTKGHQALWEYVGKQASKIQGDGVVYTSWSQNQKKNPLSPEDKTHYIKETLNDKITLSEDTSLKNAYQILEDLIKKGYTNIQFIVGEDRKNDYDALHKYAKEWSSGEARVKIINFSGDSRLGDYSGTRMRELVKENKFKEFYNDLPDTLSESDAKDIFDKTKIGLGL